MTDAQKILNEMMPVIRDVFWIARCWNDHNYDYADLLERVKHISDTLTESKAYTGTGPCNDWLERAKKAVDGLSVGG